jgi:hypothetical protein
MKALDKDRRRRYDTPGHFAEDVERYLRREAILARPPSALYKLKKFLRRNWVMTGLFLALTWVPSLVVLAFPQAVKHDWLGMGIGDLIKDVDETWRKELAAEEKAKEAAQTREAQTRAVLDFVLRLRHFEKTKDAAGCRATAEMWEKLNRADAESLYTAARLRATTAAVLKSTPGADATRLAKEQADRAMAWLKEAVTAGYKDAAQMEADPLLDALRDRQDFKKLAAELQAGPTEKKPKP